MLAAVVAACAPIPLIAFDEDGGSTGGSGTSNEASTNPPIFDAPIGSDDAGVSTDAGGARDSGAQGGKDSGAGADAAAPEDAGSTDAGEDADDGGDGAPTFKWGKTLVANCANSPWGPIR